ncbi:helix-turn-helix domain-containing protein [Mucilaginibacter pallidiroseus]|uniref:Helix-turn-helix domain-containing protein n=1 Tax=Mucilaginibacter pallidiroseus TaxID=2599295 RepID=A0A563U3H2_9SPHI|nr:AraC family transcriptional regulator [Mucilaginibacter pallidiroseus]TWR25872.1 helix-turn-helix domain-containing protein [Mucilaginibacter pallidiroseus]
MSVSLAPVKNTIPSYPLLKLDGSGPCMIQVRRANGIDAHIEPAFLKPHRKDFYLFVFSQGGGSRHWVDFIPYTVRPNHFYFTVPHQVLLKEETQPLKGFSACFTEEFLQLEENRTLRRLPIIQNPASAHELELSDADMAYIGDVMDKMATEYKQGGDWQNQMLTSWLRVLVIYLSRIYNEQYGETRITENYCHLKHFQQLIAQHYETVHNVNTYAELLNLTPGYLNDVVKQQSGKTAITHIHNRLVMEAKRRLLHTDLSVKQIADELGFEDAAYFNRFFKRLTDATPIAYRQQIREKYR